MEKDPEYCLKERTDILTDGTEKTALNQIKAERSEVIRKDASLYIQMRGK